MNLIWWLLICAPVHAFVPAAVQQAASVARGGDDGALFSELAAEFGVSTRLELSTGVSTRGLVLSAITDGGGGGGTAANAVLLQVRSAGGDDVVFKGRLAL